MRTWKNFILTSILFMASVCVAFVIGEVGLRLAGYRGAPQSYIGNVYEVQDPVLDWRYIPGSEVRLGGLVFKYNRSGFRDVDHELTKPEGVKRVVVVGDSVSEGNGVKSDEVFARALQAQLGRDHEVINIAASGLNTPQEVHLFELEGLPYGPDIVVLNFVLNDVDFYSNLAGTRRYYAEMDKKIQTLGISIDPEFKRLLKRSALIYFVKERVGHLLQRFSGDGSEVVDFYTALWSEESNRDKATSGFKKLGELKNQNEFEVVVMIWPLLVDYSKYPYGWIHKWIEEEAGKNGFVAIDLLPEYAKFKYRELQVQPEDTVHPNALGHSVAVGAFSKWYQVSRIKKMAEDRQN